MDPDDSANRCAAPARRCTLPGEGYAPCGAGTLNTASLGDPRVLLRRLLVALPPPTQWVARWDHETWDEPRHDKVWSWGRGDARVTLHLKWSHFSYPCVYFADVYGRDQMVGEEIDVERVLARVTAASGRPAPPRPEACCPARPLSTTPPPSPRGGGFRAVIAAE